MSERNEISNSTSDKPLIIRWIGPVLMITGLLSVIQGLTALLGGMQLPGVVIEYFVYQNSSDSMQPMLLGQIPSMVAMTLLFLWYFYQKKKVVEYYNNLQSERVV